MARTISVRTNVKVTEQDFQRHVALYCLVMNKSLGEVVKETAKLLCADMVDYTPPWSGSQPQTTKGGEGGFGNRARDKGRKSVDRDVRKIFKPLAQASAATVANNGDAGIFEQWIAAKKKLPPPHYPDFIFQQIERQGGFATDADFKRFQQIEKSKGAQEGRFNTQVTDGWIQTNHFVRRGGAPGSNKLYKVREGINKDTLYVQPWKAVENYITKVQRRVGRLKSGWYAAYKALGGVKQGQWIAQQGSGEMILVKDDSVKSNPRITVGNKIGRNFTQSWTYFNKAISHRAFAMRVKILKHLANPRNHGRLEDVARRLPSGFNIEET